MFVWLVVCVCVSVCACLWLSLCVFVCVSVNACVFNCLCVYICGCVCVYVFMCMCLCVCVCDCFSLLALQVFLQADGTGVLYDSVTVDERSAVNSDLLLDSTGQSVYVLTQKKVPYDGQVEVICI